MNQHALFSEQIATGLGSMLWHGQVQQASSFLQNAFWNTSMPVGKQFCFLLLAF